MKVTGTFIFLFVVSFMTWCYIHAPICRYFDDCGPTVEDIPL